MGGGGRQQSVRIRDGSNIPAWVHHTHEDPNAVMHPHDPNAVMHPHDPIALPCDSMHPHATSRTLMLRYHAFTCTLMMHSHSANLQLETAHAPSCTLTHLHAPSCTHMGLPYGSWALRWVSQGPPFWGRGGRGRQGALWCCLALLSDLRACVTGDEEALALAVAGLQMRFQSAEKCVCLKEGLEEGRSRP